MAEPRGVLGLFADPGRAARALVGLRASGCEVRFATAVPYPQIEEAMAAPKSRLGWITLAAGLGGAALGALLATWVSYRVPLIGGRPAGMSPPYVVIAFELAMLLAGLANLLAVVVGAWIARRRRPVPTRATSAADLVGVFVPDGDAVAEETLRACGAGEVLR